MSHTHAPLTAGFAVIGCGNLVRGDDGVGPRLIRRLWDMNLPAGVRLIDGGTAGMDVAFQLKGVARAIIVDASHTGAEPGTIFEVPGEQVANPGEPDGGGSHSFRWDNALAFGTYVLGDSMPKDISVYLIEAAQVEPDAPLSPEVEEAMEQVATRIAAECAGLATVTGPAIELPRPQPMGIFPLPASFLLVPGTSKVAGEIRAGLAAGKLPAQWPKYMAGVRLAYEGDLDAARDVFSRRAARSVIDQFNLYVIDPDAVDPDQLRAAMGAYAPLVDLVAFTLGQRPEPPEAGTLDGELAALILSAQVSAWGAHSPRHGRELLGQAISLAEPAAPALQALLRVARADLIMEHSASEESRAEALSDLELADGLLAGSDLALARAEIAVGTAALYQSGAADNAGMGQQAIAKYHQALALIDRKANPELFATAHVNLAACYLTMPMAHTSDSLRYAVAVQSLRAALEVFTPAGHPQQWASAQLNLANALASAPTLRRGENLLEAIELYQAVIEARSGGQDELGRARAMANQGSALAQIGSLERAGKRLSQAKAIFEELGQAGEARAVGDVLDEVTQLAGKAR